MPAVNNSLPNLLKHLGKPDEVLVVDFDGDERLVLLYMDILKLRVRQQVKYNGTYLTKTEQEILRLLESGLTDNAIADELNLTVQNVRMHKRNARKKGG